MSEASLQRQVQMLAPRCDGRLFRNQVGQYEIDGRYIKTGLGPGSSDLIGWTTRTITPDMVGKKVAIFTAIETKRPNAKTASKRLEAQKRFVTFVRLSGGIAGIVYSLDRARELLEPSREGGRSGEDIGLPGACE